MSPENGKSFYRKGSSPLSPKVTVRLAGSDTQLPASNFACTNCHGSMGQGQSEAGVSVPQIDWDALTNPRPASPSARARPAYDLARLQRAIIDGLDADGGQLTAGMPRYQLNASQMADLTAYLQVLGTNQDNDPGVGEDFVDIGTMLPLTGPKAKIGRQVAGALNGYFDRVNRQGGVYRRRIQLNIVDSGGDDAASGDAFKRLAASGSFALVASFVLPDPRLFQASLAESEVPLIGPLGIVPREPERRSRATWYLVPSFADQARVLVDHISAGDGNTATKTPLRVSLVHANTPDCDDAAAGAKIQLTLHQMVVAADLLYQPSAFDAAEAARLAMTDNPEWVLFFGPAADLEAFAAAQTHPASIGTLALLTPLARPLGMTTLVATPDQGRFQGQSAFQGMALAAARVLIEAMSRRGRKLDRAGLRAELEQMREFDTGILPPISFSPGNHIGVSGAAILRFDASSSRYELDAPWRKPADIPR